MACSIFFCVPKLENIKYQKNKLSQLLFQILLKKLSITTQFQKYLKTEKSMFTNSRSEDLTRIVHIFNIFIHFVLQQVFICHNYRKIKIFFNTSIFDQYIIKVIMYV